MLSLHVGVSMGPAWGCDIARFGRRLVAVDVDPSVAGVAVWQVGLGLSSAEVDEAMALLTDEERAHSSRCRPDVARARVIARGALRIVLSSYVGVAPEELEFGTDATGKPLLSGPTGRGWHFSVSHSASCCLVAVSERGPVGVDIEDVTPLPDLAEITQHYFAPDEAAEILRRTGPARTQAFFRCWVQKEAYLKARGVGLRHGLKHCSVAVQGRAGLRSAMDDDARVWLLAPLRPGPDLVGAVAVRR
jgi:4'-phosphopantetheinyl transferase